MKDKIDSVIAIIYKNNKFLLAKRSIYEETAQGYWCPVGGHIEKGETQQEAIEREVKEEVNLWVEAKEKFSVISSVDNRYRLHWWTTDIISGTARAVSQEINEIKWVTLGEMRLLEPIYNEDIQIFEKFMDSIEN